MTGEREMNPVAMTIINPRTRIGEARVSNQQHHVLNANDCVTEAWLKKKKMQRRNGRRSLEEEEEEEEEE